MCKSLGGDFYDFIRLNESQIALVVGDIVGHGVQASLLMAQIMGWLRSDSSRHNRPTRIVEDLNLLLLDLGEKLNTSLLCSLIYGVLDIPSGLFIYVNAGHPTPILCDREKCTLAKMSSNTVLLGAEKFKAKEMCHTFQSGERVVFFTDGVIEALNEQEEEFTDGRLREIVHFNLDQGPEETADSVFGSVEKFRGTLPPRDDETVVVMDYL
jgi:sigma-B regulation protein RsbU (phosphoserine phosphatase)